MEKIEASQISSARSHQVSLVMYGMQGVAGPLELGDGKPMEPGCTGTFKVSFKEMKKKKKRER